jgi:sugar phosphate permease
LYFYITWLPTYLLEARKFSIASTKWLAALPWVLSASGFWFGGWVTDYLVKRTGNLKIARCGVGATGYAAGALTIIAVAHVKNDLFAAYLLALALWFQTMTISAAWAVCLDVGKRNAGVVTGFMNTVGNIGGALAPVVVGYAVNELHSWTLPFYVMAGVFGFGILMWLLVDPKRSVLGEFTTKST